jgi:NAD(P)-dependent dehydrogenase (short-subunit alcohol dehydrogenase family)
MTTVLITGASSGLGASLAREHARLGHAVVLFARRSAPLKALVKAIESNGGAALAVTGDVTRRGDLDRAVRQALKRFGSLDIVYANAGFGVRGLIAGLDLERWRRQQAVNVEGLLNTVWACLPALKASKGRLGLVGSVLGFGTVPGFGAYAASKFAVNALALTLRTELKANGISVTHIAPGFFTSEFRQRDAKGRHDPRLPDPAPRGWSIPSARAAVYASQAVLARRREVVFPFSARLLVALYRFAPTLALSLAAIARPATSKR